MEGIKAVDISSEQIDGNFGGGSSLLDGIQPIEEKPQLLEDETKSSHMGSSQFNEVEYSDEDFEETP